MGSEMSFIIDTPRSTALILTVMTVILLGNRVLQADGPSNVNLFRPFSPPLSTPLTSVEAARTETTGKASLDDSVALTGYSIKFADDFLPEKPHGLNLYSPDDALCSDGSDCWTWQCLPNGLMYKSYLAGVREPRFGVIWANLDGRPEEIGGRGNIWEATLGGRVGVLRYGSNDIIDPQGWQLDMEGAVFPRLDMDSKQDVIAMDFRFGAPLTYRRGGTSYKFGYYHISSHLGDEFMISYPFFVRDNYVREALLLGISHELNDYLRIYGEAAYAVFDGGIVEPWEFKFGAEYSALARSGVYSSPFAAVHAHLREELDYSGFVNMQVGWQWRGPESDHLWRIGLHYFNGAVSQHALGRGNEEMLGFGIWYDY
jgi:hypothetical protein